MHPPFFLSAIWTLILTAPIHCRGFIDEQVNFCSHEETISPTSWMIWGCTFFQNIHFWVNYSFKGIVHPRMKITPCLTHPQAILGVYGFFISDKYNQCYIKKPKQVHPSIIQVKLPHCFTSEGFYSPLEPCGALLWWMDALFWASKSQSPFTAIINLGRARTPI